MKFNIIISGLMVLGTFLPGSAAYRHPGMLTDANDIQFIKSKIAAGEQPWKNAYTDLLRRANLSFTPSTPCPEIYIGFYGEGQDDNCVNNMRASNGAAYFHALAWVLTGNQAYANKTIQILNIWSYNLKKMTGDNAGLETARGFNHMHMGAELIRHTNAGWKAADIAQYETFCKTVIWPNVKYGSTGMNYNGNWPALKAQACLEIGVFCNDDVMYNDGLKIWQWLLPNYIYSDGKCQETCRDMHHTQMGLEGLTMGAEIAHKQGINLYGQLNNRLELGIEHAVAMILGLSGYPDPGCVINSPSLSDFDFYEIVYNHYHNRLNLSAPYCWTAVQQQRNKLSYVGALYVLTHANNPGTASNQVAMPVISPAGGAFTGSVQVSITCGTSGATIRYTTNGSNPTSSSTLYSSPFKLTVTATVKAIGIKSGMNNSLVASAAYTLIPASCRFNDGTWQNTSFAAQTGSFTARFSATPMGAPIDGLVSLSQGLASEYSRAAVIVRFNPQGQIDARNGGAYAAARTITYAAGMEYRFRATVDVPNHTYSVYVTPPGSGEVLLAQSYGFRTEQAGVIRLDTWNAYATTGEFMTCGFGLASATPVGDNGHAGRMVTDDRVPAPGRWFGITGKPAPGTGVPGIYFMRTEGGMAKVLVLE